MRDFKDLKIAVAGTGYVGLSLSVLLAQHNQVMAVDIVQAKVDMINNHKSPIQDDYIEKYPNIKEMYSDAEWEKFRQEDGHIYWIATAKIGQQPIMMKHSGFSARYWSGPDIHRLTLWTNISSY